MVSDYTNNRTMKTDDKPIAPGAVACLAVLLSTLLVACAATKTSESTGGYFDDAAITAKVKTAIATDPHLANPWATPFEIRAKTYKGVVQLSGFVNSQAVAQQAATDAGQVPGVKQVVNNLIVKPNLSGTSG
jgi:hypothetical protein